MAVGMTYADFWKSNPHIATAYFKAQEKIDKRTDEKAWLFGSYAYEAVYVAIGKFFGGDSFDGNYPEQPHSYGEISEEEKEARRLARQKKEEEREIQRLIAQEERQIAILRRMGLPESNTR